MPITTPPEIKAELESLGTEYLAVYEERAGKNDQRVGILNKRLNLIASAKSKPADQKADDQKAAEPKADSKLEEKPTAPKAEPKNSEPKKANPKK
jgi:hypothetical protein